MMRSGGKRVVDIETQRLAACVRNQVVGNVFYGFDDRGPKLPADENLSDHNVFVSRPGEEPFDLARWQERTGLETHSTTCASQLRLSPADWTLRRDAPLAVCLTPRLPAITFDFFSRPRQGSSTPAGPFVLQDWESETVLWHPFHEMPRSEGTQ